MTTPQRKQEEFDRATKAATDLAASLGPAWKPHVWENLGWHYSAISPCGRIKIHAHSYNREVSYTAFLGDADSAGGYWAKSGDTPAKAIEAVKKVMTAELTHIASFLTAFEGL